MDSEADDYELTGSEQEYDEDEREILEDLRKQRNKRKQDASAPQEILAFSDDDEDEDDNVADLMRDSDIEGADDDDGHLPNTMDWGSKRSTYYNTDFVDPDYSSYNAQEEEEAKAEEEEAKKIQLRLAKRFSEADFQLDDVPAASSDDEADGDVAKSKGIKVTADLTGLTERERLQLLQKDSPEFLGLTQDFQLHLAEVQLLITPVLNYVRNHQVPMVPALQFASLYHNVLSTYCSNVSYYLLLKARRINFKLHPVVKRLVQLKQLREQLTPRYETFIKPQLEALLERIQDGDAFTVLDVAQRKAKLQILNRFEQSNAKENGTATAEVATDGSSDDEDDDAHLAPDQDEAEEGDDDPEAEAVRRGITYQMAKNKGLTPHRKKELRNPRVKHRGKYRKALIRRKGAVRAVRKETQRYGGEMSGIKATVTKSVKFRT
ncbi:something about silencing protein 10 [Drosophila guanche]|uniref:Blast:Something about silencing protein 10 n=1 Tax=Drosophila guanche TaxID=7266 RepID=A0A3B0KRK4_DROGU|nr:something about silencing protein 10 [Drosophila guanche]SPP89279.1 blast:Something about silencing protein 10 [Drosophila guanche]